MILYLRGAAGGLYTYTWQECCMHDYITMLSVTEIIFVVVSTMDGKCPGMYHCNDGSHGYSVVNSRLRQAPEYTCLVSAILSVIGAAIIVTAYCAFKDLRRGAAQMIITMLALADIGTALGFLLGVGNSFTYYYFSESGSDDPRACQTFYSICEIQAFTVLCCAFSSYTWSAVLAIHFLMIIVLNYSSWIEKLMPLYNIVAWILPLTLYLPLLISGQLGYTPTQQTSCYISAEATYGVKQTVKITETNIIVFLAMLSSIITAICYIAIVVYLCGRVRGPLI